jgi:hypothetical protein
MFEVQFTSTLIIYNLFELSYFNVLHDKSFLNIQSINFDSKKRNKITFAWNHFSIFGTETYV